MGPAPEGVASGWHRPSLMWHKMQRMKDKVTGHWEGVEPGWRSASLFLATGHL
jgi:hypothetical protein